MNSISDFVIKRQKLVVSFVLALTVLFTFVFFTKVGINYNMTDYLPPEANSTVALNTMSDEFGESLPNCNVRVENVSIQEALQIKQQLSELDGIEDVSWLDDMVDVKKPLEVQDQDIIDDYYKNGNALFSVAIADGQEKAATERIQNLLGEETLMSGAAVDQADAQRLALSQTLKAICILAPLIILILMLATTSWIEPFIYLLAIGAAALINLGTEVFHGEISYVTLAVAPILQLAVSLDYAIFLSHSFQKHRLTAETDAQAMKLAMKESMKSILASALTTIFGFVALTLMDFRIGPDMGISLVKGVILSFVSCMTFLPAAILLMNKWIDKTRHRSFMPSFKGAGKVAVRISMPAAVIMILVCLICYPAQKQNHFTYGASDTPTEAATVIAKEFGEKNTMVLMVPNTDRTKEKLLCEDIEAMDHVTQVLSYTTQVGAEIPPEYLSDEIRNNFYGENYARIIVYSALPDESEEAFALVENVRSTAREYYGDDILSCGQSANLYDMKTTIESDNKIVNIVTVLAIYLILAFMTKSWLIPIPLILVIKASIWVNMAIPYFTGSSLIYLGYLVVSTVQMGATIDYAILLTNNYLKNRKEFPMKRALQETMGESISSVLVSASVLAIAGFALALASSNSMVVALGILIGRGALLPLVLVNLCLPALLMLIDKLIPFTTWKAGFFKDTKVEETNADIEIIPATTGKISGFLGVSKTDSYDDTDGTV